MVSAYSIFVTKEYIITRWAIVKQFIISLVLPFVSRLIGLLDTETMHVTLPSFYWPNYCNFVGSIGWHGCQTVSNICCYGLWCGLWCRAHCVLLSTRFSQLCLLAWLVHPLLYTWDSKIILQAVFKKSLRKQRIQLTAIFVIMIAIAILFIVRILHGYLLSSIRKLQWFEYFKSVLCDCLSKKCA